MKSSNLSWLLVALLVGCGDDDGLGAKTVEISFAAAVGAQAAACGASYADLGTTDATAQIKDLRFYVTNVRLAGTDGEVEVTLDADGLWQDGRVALLDFEDGTGLSAGSGDSAMNTTVRGTAPSGGYDQLAFDIAVPFDLNHLDITAGAPPLDRTAMYWAWAIGYKFFRVDFDVDGTAWNVHLGSHGCPAADMMSPPTAACERQNKATVRLTNFDPDSDVVSLDLAALVATSDITANTDMTAFGCQSFPNDTAECTTVYPTLGMDWDSGDCVSGCAGQTVFSVQP